MSKKGCELCSNPARMFCESDQASLCWDCDEKVHGANFLVAKHTRSLLCHVCQSPTPWKAAGAKLGPTVSICHTCAENQVTTQRDEDDDSQESESDDGEYYSDSDDYVETEEEEEEDGENQVVPWSNSSYTPPSPPQQPPVASSSSSEADNVSFTSLKRMRDNPFESEDEDACCSLESKFTASNLSSGHCFQESEIMGSPTTRLFRPLKLQRDGEEAPIKSRTAAIVASLRRLQQEIASGEEDASAIILGLTKLTRDS